MSMRGESTLPRSLRSLGKLIYKSLNRLKIFKLDTLNFIVIMSQTVEVLEVAETPSYSPLQNIAVLGLALLIDFVDDVPIDLLFLIGLAPVSIGYDAAITVAEAAFLSYMGVPATKWLAMSGTDLIPVVNLMPWCTLAVLDKRFGIKIPVLTRLFN